MKMQVEVESNREAVISELRRKISLVLNLIGETAEGYAVENCPVDTGRLRNSITKRTQDDSVYIGTNVEYAKYVEFNEKARHDPPEFGGGRAHFLRDAVQDHAEEYKDIAELILTE